MNSSKRGKNIIETLPTTKSWHIKTNANLVDMPPILSCIINPLPDYWHDHLVLVTAWMNKHEFLWNKKKIQSSHKYHSSISILVSGSLCNICKMCSMRTPRLIASSIQNLEEKKKTRNQLKASAQISCGI